jgi:nucleoporin NUP2
MSAVERSLEKDAFIDLSSLFPQYTKHRSTLDDKFEYAKELSAQKTSLELGFKPQESHADKPAAATFQFGKVETAKPSDVAQPFGVAAKPFSSGFVFPPKELSSEPSNSQAPKPFTFPPINSSQSTVQDPQPPQKELEAPKAFQFTFPPKEALAIEPFVPTPSLPSPKSQSTLAKPLGGFSFPSVPSLPAFGTSSDTKNVFTFPPPSNIQPFQPANTQQQTEQNEEDGDEIPVGEEESFTSVRTNEELLKRGEGEEEEEELLAAPIRCKLFQFNLEGNTWTDLGIGFLKVNRNRGDRRGRVLCRAEGSGRVLLNATINPTNTSLQWEEGKRELSITIPVQAKLSKFLVRAKEVDQARSLHKSISECLTMK